MKYLYLAAMLAAFAAPAQAENWRMTGYNDDLPAIIVFVDTDSVSLNGDSVNFTLRVYGEGNTADTDELSIQRRSGSCSDVSYQVMSEQYYVGTKLTKETNTPGEIITSDYDTIDESTMDSVCGVVDYVSERIEDPAQYAGDHFAELAHAQGN